MPYGRHTDSHPPTRRRTRALAAAGLLVTLLATGACGASSGGDDQGLNSAADQKAAAPAGVGAGAKDAEKSGAGTSSTPKPGSAVAVHVIRTATLGIEVKSVPKAVAAARATTEGAGGLVAEENTERVDDTHEVSHLVLRVPQDAYAEVLRDLAGTGKLLSRTSNAKDVTGQVVDVESRIATQRASVTRVRDLMDKAEKLTDVVTLEGELSSRQADLESLLAQQKSLKDRTTLATVTLELNEPEAEANDPQDEDTGFLDALSGGWDAFVTVLRWITVAIGATAPFLAAAAVLVLLWRLLRGRLPRRRTTAPGKATEPAEAPPAP
ncbi:MULTISPECIES: DUF4349 domain-containing protein [unclassified Streptomyces]|uniref:DUF4349 domain-containing protein n=1 Tax=unclassified Streptomyces TaxID=2593676 RepID=UPI002E2F5FC1|nr:DUF4349 domain-containing protein [Streptomyces sp. NBC_01460]WSS26115.1 DUF4349 domain-containing protein [Streptomyces sp. NBC_01185]